MVCVESLDAGSLKIRCLRGHSVCTTMSALIAWLRMKHTRGYACVLMNSNDGLKEGEDLS
eukprot:48936-Eustigmatos_ZCMA.PRE.1